MKTFFTLVGLLLVGNAGFAAQTGIELRGVLIEVGIVRLSLLDRSNDTTRWVEVGQSFAGYKVTAYDPSTETATLNKDGADLRVRLNSSQIKQAAPATASTLSREEIQKAVLNNLRKIAGASDQYYLESGKNTVTVAELVGPTKYIKELTPVDGESYTGMQLKPGVPITVTTAQGVTVSFLP